MVAQFLDVLTFPSQRGPRIHRAPRGATYTNQVYRTAIGLLDDDTTSWRYSLVGDGWLSQWIVDGTRYDAGVLWVGQTPIAQPLVGSGRQEAGGML